jgi:hypothetical protein
MDITRIINANNWWLYRAAVRLSSIVPRKTNPLCDSRIIFVAGIEGSGTSIMERLIGSHHAVLQTKHTYEHPLERPDCDRIELLQRISVSWSIQTALERLWETRPPCPDHSRLDQISSLRNIRIPEKTTSAVIKRSYPSGRAGTIIPVMQDLEKIGSGLKVVRMKRSVDETMASILRRGFVMHDIAAKQRCSAGLVSINAQVNKLNSENVLCIEYDELVSNVSSVCRKLEQFLGFGYDSLSEYECLVVSPGRS